MALVVYDRIQQTGTANTTVSFTLSATTTGYQSFAVVGNGNTTYYSANDGTNWEVGIGTYSTTGPTLTRTTILSSSNSGSAVTFTGTVTVFCDYPAGKAVIQDANGNVAVTYNTSGSGSIGSLNVGGSINGASDTGIIQSLVGTADTYVFTALQNKNTGATANTSYSSYALYNNTGSVYGEIGMNSNNYSYSAAGFPNNSLSLPNATFMEAGAGSDLVLGTYGSNPIHFLTNGVSSTTDAVVIGTDNSLTVNGTITGQTEVLKGTGENLLTYSQSFTSNWLFASGTFVSNNATDPLGTTTAATLTMSGATTANFYQNVTVTNGITYTWSIYAKAGTTSTVQLICYATGNVYQVNCNLSSGTISSTSGTGTSTITSAGNGWYRITGTATATSAGTGYLQVNIVGNANTCYLWGAQLEVGTTANAFVATTSSLVYGTPTLSFSGVAGLGLQSDGSLYVSPAGTGALQAQATTSSTVGGNARGANAVDWQMVRSSASQVASGSQVVIGGGQNNTATSQFSGVFSGYANTANNYQAVVVGGTANTASQTLSAVVGGSNNTASGIYNFIGGGVSNSGTANAVVTTQATTAVTSGSTAVTLSTTNANIKVGQLVTGTGIAASPAPYTYVAAISGTSLTLSQNANATGTPTLSFYTPHGVVVGGGNNQATGSYSFIGGGGDAGTAAQRNAATGDWSAVVGGRNNLASGLASFVGGGGTSGDNNTNGNQATAQGSMILGGLGNRATGQGSSVSAGWANQANGDFSAVINGQYATCRAIQGVTVFGSNLPLGYGTGYAQAEVFILGRITTDATSTVITTNQGGASNNNQVILPNNSAYYFKASIISGVTGGGNSKAWTIEGLIKRGANAASTALVGTPVVNTIAADSGASTWTVTATADTTNGGLAITFTGQASTTIRTVCSISTTEMTY